MKKKKGIFLSCEEANHTCDKTQYNEASIWEKIKLNLHLLYCRVCREYTKNNTKLSKLMKNKSVEIMPESNKEQLKKAFDKELANQK